MNRQIIKKLILCLMTVILCVTTCAPAFASKGDRTLMHFSDEEQANDCYINSAFRMGDGFCIYYREGSMNPKQIILRYADATDRIDVPQSASVWGGRSSTEGSKPTV